MDEHKLSVTLPVQGWRQFLTARTQMLDSFDRAREQAKAHEVEVFHGRVAEAEFRKWLGAFLPKRYGVTAGYVISQGLGSSEKAPHFDVIIYDQLEAPVLWIEDSPDASPQGRSLAIPVEYVKGVIEVKSSLSSTSAKDGLDHLADLLPVMRGQDAPDERYKLYLPPKFICGLAFFDAGVEAEFSEGTLSKFNSGIRLRGFFGGIVLRGAGHAVPASGRISLLRSLTPIESTIGPGKGSLLHFCMTKSVEVAEDVHIGTMMMWNEAAFSQFAFDLVALLQGTYEVGRLSSFYGMGTSRSDGS